jgi:hypothetical protein
VSEDLRHIKDLRTSLKVPQRASLLTILDEALEILESIERRLRYIEKPHEETEG